MYLVLPGFSLKNKAEAEAIASALEAKGKTVYMHKWRHWAENNQDILFNNKSDAQIKWDPQAEIQIIEENLKEPFSIVAKSIGTYVASALLLRHIPDKLILMGIPVNDLSTEELDVYYNLGKLKEFTVIQNLHDDHGAATQVEALLTGTNYKLFTKQASDHRYPYIDDILSILDIK
jgi:hypothetical protein